MEKIALITGGNSGIGREAAVQLALQGFIVIIACRNENKGKIALDYIKNKSKSDKINLVKLDLSLKSSIKACSVEIHKNFQHIDVLINNAAIFDISQKTRQITTEGYETVWMTNYIGPTYLNSLLLDLLSKGKIINIASKGLIVKPALNVDLKDPEFKNRKFKMSKAYYQSKLAQIMYTYYLAEKLKDKNISVNIIRVTAVKVDMNRFPNVSNFKKKIYSLKSKKSITPEQMAKTYTYLAMNDCGTGKYYDENNNIVSSSKYSRNPQNIQKVAELAKSYIK